VKKVSGIPWSLEDFEKYNQLVLGSVDRIVCYEKNRKMFLLIIFKDESCIDYFRQEMAFVLNDNPNTLQDFAGKPYRVQANHLFIELAENFQPKTITTFPVPVQGATTHKEREFKITGFKFEAGVPETLEQLTAECLKT
jgi:hypothetical protein